MPGSAADEALLDTEVAGGLAPKAKIYFYTSADTDLSSGLFDAVLRAIDDNTVSILSMSFSNCEASLGSSNNALVNEAAQQAAAQGISFTVSAGDGGSAGCDNFANATAAQYGFAVNGFASTPYTIAVGGTDFDGLPASFATYANSGGAVPAGAPPFYRTALKYIPENPWNDSTRVNGNLSQNVAATDSNGLTNIIAGGGGVSSVYAKPAFQTSLTPNDNLRDLPDVSFLSGDGMYQALWALCSDNTTDGVQNQSYTDCQNANGTFQAGTYFGGAGGTSAAAPAFAGMLALISQSQGGARLGQANYVLYQLASSKPSVFHDITTGNNSVPCASGSPNCGTNGFLTGYNAAAGYDTASGLGSVDLNALINAWSSNSLISSNTTLQINGSTAAYTGTHSASLTFNVGVNPTSATGNVAIIDTANETSGGTVSGPQNNGQFTISVNSGTGAATYNGLPGGTYTVWARYGGDSSDASSTSNPISVTIAPEASTTILRVNAYNPLTGASVAAINAPYGSALVADAQVEGTAEGSNTQGLVTGTVTFANAGTTLGTASFGSENVASWPPSSGKLLIPSAGSYTYSASYSGDASYNSSASAVVPVTISQAATALRTTNVPASVYDVYGLTGIYTQFQVTLTTPYNRGTAPTGTISITANGQSAYTSSSQFWNLTTQGTGATATWVMTTPGSVPDNLFQTGPNTINVTYSGDTNYAASSATATITDMDGIGSFTMSGSGDVTVIAGLTAHEEVTLTPSGGFSNSVTIISSPLPSGFHIYNGLGGLPVLNSQPVLDDLQIVTDWAMAPGTYPITLTAKDPTGKTVQSITFNVIVTSIPANAGLSLTNAGPVTIIADAATNNAATLTLTPVNGFIGEVNFTCAVTTSMTNAVNPPTCQNSFTWITTAASQTITLPFTTQKSTTPGNYTVTVTATDGINASITATTTIPLTVTPWDGVSISIVPFTLTIGAGATIGNTLAITLTPSGGFTGTVNLSCLGPLSEPSGAVSPAVCVVPTSVNISGPGPVTAALTANTTASTTIGTYSFGVNVYDAATTAWYSGTDISVNVQAGPGLSITKSGDITIAPGATTGNTSTLTLTPSGGLTGQVNLTCALTSQPAGASDLPTCSVPSAVTISGTTAVTAALTISTTAASRSGLELPLRRFFLAGGGATLAVVVFFGIPARRRAWRALFSLLAVTFLLGTVGCGGGGGSGGSGGGGTGGGTPGTTAGTYTVTVTGIDAATGKITATTIVTVTVT